MKIPTLPAIPQSWTGLAAIAALATLIGTGNLDSSTGIPLLVGLVGLGINTAPAQAAAQVQPPATTSTVPVAVAAPVAPVVASTPASITQVVPVAATPAMPQ